MTGLALSLPGSSLSLLFGARFRSLARGSSCGLALLFPLILVAHV
jgi:hypothetical protein